jgi:hypothetical protein
MRLFSAVYYRAATGSIILAAFVVAGVALGFAGAQTSKKQADKKQPTKVSLQRSDKRPVSAWLDVTTDVGGERWGDGGVTFMASVPGGEEVIAGVSEVGLWVSRNGGITWRQLNTNTPITNRPSDILFDPKDPKTFWIAGIYGKESVYKTTDGGQTLKSVMQSNHMNCVAVDFTDEYRRTLLASRFETPRALYMTSSSGIRWANLSDKLPATAGMIQSLVCLDENTFFAHTTDGLYRTRDGGQVWLKVSNAPCSGNRGTAARPALYHSDGSVYLQMKPSGLIRIKNKGLIVEHVGGPLTSPAIEIPGGAIVGLGSNQLYISRDGCRTWKPIGPPVPMPKDQVQVPADGVIYNPKHKAFFVWRIWFLDPQKKKGDRAIFRWSPDW